MYDSESDNILEDFYVPALSQSKLYRRSVGYFSAATIVNAAQAFTTFVDNLGRVELIVGSFVHEDEFEAMLAGSVSSDFEARLSDEVGQILDVTGSDLFKCRLRALTWMVANDRLKVKVALRRRGLFHEKVGILTDETGESIVFSGSANETDKALLPGFNYESFNAFPTWRHELKEHWEPHIKKFEALWSGATPNTLVLDLPRAAEEKLIRFSENSGPPPSIEMELDLWNKFYTGGTSKPKIRVPHIPSELGGRKFEIRDHQRSALKKWKEADYRGILALATGAGKTITAIYGMVRLYEQGVRPIVPIISVPYKDLADQWVSVLQEFGIDAIPCYRSGSIWKEGLSSKIHALKAGASDFFAVVVVNKTLSSEPFQQRLSQIPPERIFWIGDECHHHGSLKLADSIPSGARFILGLSATPEHYLDEIRNDRISKIYGDVVDEYPLSRAVKEGILTPYKYHIIPVQLTAEEADLYRDLSDQIARMFAVGSDNAEENGSSALQAKLRERSRLVASARNKISAFEELLESISEPIPFSLVYCGDGVYDIEELDDDDFQKRQIEVVSEKLRLHGWKNSRFTARESNQARKEILKNFADQSIDSLVAIKCLDEGIDIPACSTAFFLASSRDPRQFVQRRGRILRRHKGKTSASIYDFLVVLPDHDGTDPRSKRLLKAELGRVAEFAQLSTNWGDTYETLRPILSVYGLEHLI